MGRHSAPVAFDAPAGVPFGADAHPTTDPMLLVQPADAPPPPLQPVSATPTPALPRPKPASRALSFDAFAIAANPAVLEHRQALHPRPVAPVPAPIPRAVDGRRSELAFSDAPIGIAPRLAAADLKTAPLPIRGITGPSSVIATEPVDAPRAFEKRRTVALAACAVAVLGAVSAAAAILPASHADASPGGRCVDLSAQPRPAFHPVKHSGKQLREAKRAHRGTAAAPGQSSTASSTSSAPSASATPSASVSASASASPSSSASASASPTGSAAASPSPSSDPVTEVVGSLAALISRLTGGQAASLASGVYSFKDFTSSGTGVALPGGLIGAGESKTVVEMTARSSTKAGLVPTGNGTTNPLSLMKVQGGSPVFRDFTLQGTAQGHLYNGLVIKGTSGARITDVRINAIPGNDKVNPGETFGINDFRTSGSVYKGVEIDGQGVGASALAFNSSSSPTIEDSYFHNNPYSAGLALWQTQNATITDVISTNNRTGINLERTSGTINVVRPTLGNNSAQDFYIGSDQASVKLNIIDPKVTGKIRIKIPTNYWAGAQQQRRSDVHVIVNGVDRTNEMVQWI